MRAETLKLAATALPAPARRTLLLGVGALTALLAMRAAHGAKMMHVAWLATAAPAQVLPFIDIAKRALRERGFVEGQNITFHIYWSNGKAERMAPLAAEIVALKPDVIFALTTLTVHALQRATSTIPIVMAFVNDPVRAGFAASLAHPGGNITGVASYGDELAAKRLDLLRAVAPKLRRVGYLTSDMTSSASALAVLRASATGLGIEVVVEHAGEQLEAAFRRLARQGVTAVVVFGAVPHVNLAAKIGKLAIEHKMLTIGPSRNFAAEGCLISYGADIAQQFRMAAQYLEHILRGAKPADLPIEQPTKMELVVNRSTATALGLQLGQDFMLRVDEVIE
jgi:putative ABC transport system substrate-binding protein